MLLFTLVPLLPSNLYLFIAQKDIDPYQRALQLPQLLFLLAELVFLVVAVWSLPQLLPLLLGAAERASHCHACERLSVASSRDTVVLRSQAHVPAAVPVSMPIARRPNLLSF